MGQRWGIGTKDIHRLGFPRYCAFSESWGKLGQANLKPENRTDLDIKFLLLRV